MLNLFIFFHTDLLTAFEESLPFKNLNDKKENINM